jgi:hypothetical protein
MTDPLLFSTDDGLYWTRSRCRRGTKGEGAEEAAVFPISEPEA